MRTRKYFEVKASYSNWTTILYFLNSKITIFDNYEYKQISVLKLIEMIQEKHPMILFV